MRSRRAGIPARSPQGPTVGIAQTDDQLLADGRTICIDARHDDNFTAEAFARNLGYLPQQAPHVVATARTILCGYVHAEVDNPAS